MSAQETPKSTTHRAKNSPSRLHPSAFRSTVTHNASPLRTVGLNGSTGFKTPQQHFTPSKPIKLLRSTVKRSAGKRTLGSGVATAMTPTRVSPRGVVKRGLPADQSSREWMNTGITPKRGKKVVKAHYDRFIPNRTAMCLPSSQLNIARREAGAENYLDSATLAYQEQVARACGLALDKRILAFKSEPPQAAHDGLRSTYNRPFRTQAASAALRRRILQTPERVLDAPGLVDDYYLNLLDWSCRNTVAVGLDRSVYLWNADTGDVQALCTSRPTDSISSLRWAGDGAYLAVGTSDGDTQIWDIETQAKVRSMLGHQARVGVLSWDKHILSSGCRDGSIHNHDVRVAQHRVAELVAHTAEVCGLTWRSDGQQLASGGNDNLVNIWDARSSIPKYTKTDHKAAVKALAWCPWQANLLASGGGTHDRQIHFWNTTTSARINSIDTGSQVTALIWSKEHREILSAHGYPDNNLSIWAYPSLSKVADIPAHETRVLHTALSPDGQTVATTASDENLKFWKCFESTKAGPGSSRTQSGLGRPGRQERAEAAAAAANGSRGGLSARMIR